MSGGLSNRFSRWISVLGAGIAVLLLAAALCLAAPSGAHADDAPALPPLPPDPPTLTFNVDFSCPQSTARKIPPKMNIPFTLDMANGKTTSPDFDRLLSMAREYPYVDFFKCLLAANDSIPNSVFMACASAKNKSGVCGWSNSDQREKIEKHFDQVAAYGGEALKNGALPPFTPGGSTIPALAELKLQGMALTVLSWCGTPGPEYLDENFLVHKLPEAVKNLKNCKPEQLAHSYLSLLDDYDPRPTQCAANPAGCEAQRASIRKVLKLLADAGLSKVLDDNRLVDSSKGMCQTDDVLEKGMADLYLKTDKLAACTKLRENDPAGQIVGGGNGGSGSGISPQYKLDRRADTELKEDYVKPAGGKVAAGQRVPVYEASVKFRFAPKAGETGPSGAPLPAADAAALQEKYAKRARDCYSAEPTASKLRGPDGEFLKIKLFDPDPDAHKPDASGPPERTITVPTANVRSNSGMWTPSIDCQTIVHETMHVLGLVDEYEENADGAYVTPDGHVNFVDNLSSRDSAKGKKLEKWDCRVIGPKDSLMNSQNDAFALFDNNWSIAMCSCERYSEGAKAAKDCPARIKKAVAAWSKTPLTACPKGTVRFTPDPSWGESVTKDRLGADVSKHGWDSNLILSATPVKPSRSSLLYPAQFRAITQPGCLDADRVYYLCAREAYRTSRANLGSDDCSATLPPECPRASSLDHEKWLKMSYEERDKLEKEHAKWLE